MQNNISVCKFLLIPRVLVALTLVFWLVVVLPPTFGKWLFLFIISVVSLHLFILEILFLFFINRNVHTSHRRKILYSSIIVMISVFLSFFYLIIIPSMFSTEKGWYSGPVIIFLGFTPFLFGGFSLLFLYNDSKKNQERVRRYISLHDRLIRCNEEWNSLERRPWRQFLTWIWMGTLAAMMTSILFCPDGKWALLLFSLTCCVGMLFVHCIGRDLPQSHPWHPQSWYISLGITIVFTAIFTSLFTSDMQWVLRRFFLLDEGRLFMILFFLFFLPLLRLNNPMDHSSQWVVPGLLKILRNREGKDNA